MSTRDNIQKYIQESSLDALANQRQFQISGDLYLYIKDPLPEEINLFFVVDKLTRSIPPHLFYGVDTILVGEFDLFRKNNTNAVYEDGAIYVSNLQSDNEDMVDDIVHELAHTVEETTFDEIYGDNLVETWAGDATARNHIAMVFGEPPADVASTALPMAMTTYQQMRT